MGTSGVSRPPHKFLQARLPFCDLVSEHPEQQIVALPLSDRRVTVMDTTVSPSKRVPFRIYSNYIQCVPKKINSPFVGLDVYIRWW
jgi:hypothetical protein